MPRPSDQRDRLRIEREGHAENEATRLKIRTNERLRKESAKEEGNERINGEREMNGKVDKEGAGIYQNGSSGVEEVECSGTKRQSRRNDVRKKSNQNRRAEVKITESFWRKRMEMVEPIELPYETCETKSDGPRWETSTWFQPVSQTGPRPAKLMLLDAFVIYLARIVGENRLHIGWNLANREVVPMVINVPVEERWEAVSEVVDEELEIFEENDTVPADLQRQGTSSSPWRIVASFASDRDLRNDISVGRGELLTLQIDQRGGFRWIYDATRLESDVVRRIAEHLRELVASSKEQSPVSRLNMLPEEECDLLLKKWNVVENRVPVRTCIHTFFEEQASRSPSAPAILYEDQIVTYAELNTRANLLAHELVRLGVSPEVLVAVCVSTSPEMIVSIMAILKAGGAYLPLDPAYPSQRLVDTLNDADPGIVIADEIGSEALGVENLSKRKVVDPYESFSGPDSNPFVPGLEPSNLAYVIYTSGSTGRPKGVMIEHRNVVRLFDVTEHWYRFSSSDVWCMFHSISFDVSVWELWGALRFGGRLVLVPRIVARSSDEKQQLICHHRVTVLNQTPSAFKASISKYGDEAIPEHLKYVIFAGESLDAGVLRPLFARGKKLPRFVNMYGTTETTVHATYKVMNREDTEQSLSLVGRRFSDLRFYLLDFHGRPVPLGAVGEVYIGGAGVGRGYMNRPEINAERFLIDPFNGTGERMYRTGDLARYSPDGNLVYIGRNDHQVKIRGFRIELGEIEACLTAYPAVRETAVLARGEGQDKRLVAFVVASPEENLPQNLHEHASCRLPDYMVPSAFVRLDAFPLTPNGKLDAKALPEVDESALARRSYEAPETEVEIKLAEIWSRLLGLDGISRRDSFFALGGHSLLAVQLIEAMRVLGFDLSLGSLFKYPILSELAKSVKKGTVRVPPNIITADTEVITPDMLPLVHLSQSDIDRLVSVVPGGVSNIQDIYALSPLQDGILFHYLLATESDPYLLIRRTTFSDRAILDRYLSAVHKVVERHDVLRTAFFWEDLSTPVQVVLRESTVSITELDDDEGDEMIRDLLDRSHGPRKFRMDIRQAPLLRLIITKEKNGRWVLLEVIHHLIGDHVTFEVMHAEIKAYLIDDGRSLSSPTQFRNLIATARLTGSQESHFRFFKDMLHDVDEPTLAFGLVEIHRDGSQVTEASRPIPQELNDRLRAQVKWMEISLATLCHLAWGMVVSRISGNEKVVFGTVLFGRASTGEGAMEAMGLFINTLPIRLDIDETPTKECVQRTHTRLADLLEHEHASLALAQRCSGVAGGTPLFNTLLNYRHNQGSVSFDDVTDGVEFHGEFERTNYPFILSVDDNGTSVDLVAQAVAPYDPERLCAYMEQALESLVNCHQREPGRELRTLEVLPEMERSLQLQTWNVTLESKRDACVHQLFEEQVSRTPRAVALVCDDERVTYEELNASANRLAHRLIELGVQLEETVGLCVSVSPAMIVGVLAILKAGGPYVPLDPAYPSQRLVGIFEDVAPRIVIADQIGLDALRGVDLSSVTVLDPNDKSPGPENNPEVKNLSSKNLAYVIYTSGSTGRPKGVMIEHRHVARLFEMTGHWFRFSSSDVWTMFHSISFDVSVFELWGALHHGGRLILAPRNAARSPEEKQRLLIQHRVTVLTQTCTAFKASIFRYGVDAVTDHLKYVCFVGESLDITVLRPLFAVPGKKLPLFVNMYGPTEVTVHAICNVLSQRDTEHAASLIGKPLSDIRVYLLDPSGRPVPLGAIGEMYLGGAGVARGYMNRPEINVERFLPDPFNGTGERMYRTGDLARYLPDGSLAFMGRNDHQVKVRGFRIELGEIEVCLTDYPSVKQAVVIALGQGEEKRLVAYVVADPEEELVRNLHAYVTSKLPDYMVPSAFVRMDKFPMNPNGKLDTKAFPSVDEMAVARRTYEAPEGLVETSLSVIWGQLLNVDRVGRYDSFFALGGHSLSAMQMVNLAAERGLICTLNDLFQYPVLVDLASRIMQDPKTQQKHEPIPIRTSGTEAPVFFLPTGFGDISYAFSLSHHVRSSCPIYGLPWPSVHEDPMGTIQELASRMVTLMRSIQPRGGYRICGYSSGGILAHAMAEVLLKNGDSIDFFGFIDTPSPKYGVSRSQMKEHLTIKDLVMKFGPERREGISELAGKFNEMTLVEFVEAAQERRLYPSNLHPEEYAKRLEQRISYGLLTRVYEPRDLGFVIHQFNAVEPYDVSDFMDVVFPSTLEDPSMGWESLLPETTFKRIPIPGNHDTMMEVIENRTCLGQAISEVLPDAVVS